MTPEQDEELDYFLSLWHHWALGDKGVKGHASQALVVGDFRGTRAQYESQLEQQGIALENRQCRQVDCEVKEMADPHRSAIYADARNLYYGIAVWNSPQLPDDPGERQVILKFARAMLAVRLKSAGVMA